MTGIHVIDGRKYDFGAGPSAHIWEEVKPGIWIRVGHDPRS